jgi:bifunctional DNase/RNase
MFIECLRLASYSEGVMSLETTMSLPIYVRKKLLDRYEREKEEDEAKKSGYQVTQK